MTSMRFLRNSVSLYTSDVLSMPANFDRFLDGFDVPSLHSSIFETLSQVITDTGIGLAIQNLQAGKSPGLDGHQNFTKHFNVK